MGCAATVAAVVLYLLSLSNASASTAWSGAVPIQYDVHGAGDVAIVFVHGWACDSTFWDGQVSAMSERHTVVTLDLGGHGRSGRNRGDWSMRSFGADVVAVAQRVPARKVVLVGHSMGGAVALEAARHLRERLVAVIGVDTFHNIGAPRPDAAEAAARVAPFRADFAGMTSKMAQGSYFSAAMAPEARQRILQRMAATAPDVAIEAMIQLMQMDYAGALEGLDVPVLAINSDRRALDLDAVRKIAPRFQLYSMKGLGHFVMIEDPLRFNAILQHALDELASSRAR